MERIRPKITKPPVESSSQIPLIMQEAPFWREMLGEYVRDAIEARTWNPPVLSVAQETMIVSPIEESAPIDVDTSPTRRTLRETTTGIVSRAKEIFSAPKRITRKTTLASAAAGLALLGGFSAQEVKASQEKSESSIVTVTSPQVENPIKGRTPASDPIVPDTRQDNRSIVEKRWDPNYLPRTKQLDVAELDKEASTPPAMKAELKPKPKPKPKEQSHYNNSDASEVGSSAQCAPNLNEVKQIVCFEAKERGVANQWYAIDFIVNHESTWDPAAQNPNSTACGLFQFIDRRACDPSMPGGVQAQAVAGLDYMIDRYGSPAGAYNFWQANNWY